MPALGAGRRVIGDLVGRKPVAGGDVLRERIEIRRELRLRNGELAGGVEAGERRLLLDGELVEREVVGRHADRLFELGAPGGQRLPGPRIDQVEGKPREDGARKLHGAARILHVMDAAERLQRGVVERLHAERDAVHAGAPIAAETLRLDARRVRLQRHLRIGRDMPAVRNRIENRTHRAGQHERGRAAAEEDARDGAARRQRREMAELAREGGGEARLVRRLMADMRVEIAIGAFGGAEGPVDVDAESGPAFRDHGPASRQPARRSA